MQLDSHRVSPNHVDHGARTPDWLKKRREKGTQIPREGEKGEKGGRGAAPGR